MGKLFEEMKRRKVFRVAAVYAVVGWLLLQVADTVLPTFGAPAWVNQTLIFLFIISIGDRPRLFLCFGSIAITRNKQTWSVPHLINSRNLT